MQASSSRVGSTVIFYSLRLHERSASTEKKHELKTEKDLVFDRVSVF
jgi:hypothetical protein